MRKILMLAVMCFGVACATAHAQPPAPVVNPTALTFGASPDHDTVVEGQAVLTGYKVDVVVVAGGSVTTTFDLGKPSLNAQNVVDTPAAFSTLPNGAYVVDVYPYGPAGNGTKLRSEGQFFIIKTPASAVAPVTFH